MNENNVKKTVEDIASTWNKGDYKSKQQAISKLKMSKWFLPVKTYNFLAEKMGISLRPEESTGESKTEVIEKENILREAQKIMGGRIIDDTRICAEITKLELKPSKYGGSCNMITFKDKESGKSYISWVATNCRNYANWVEIIKSGVGCVVGGLRLKKGNLIDADSNVFIKNEE